MADLTKVLADDPTLEAADRALEAEHAKQLPRKYLGMSQIGESCTRKLWYSFRYAYRERFDADTIKRFEDGHKSEDLIAARLRMAPGVTLETVDQRTGDQFRYTDHNGHASGHCDGKITGLIQAPVKKHIWENKSTSEKKFTELKKIIIDVGEKQALRKWNATYYGQAQLYMHYEPTDRHYMTVCTPGGRNWLGLRTEYNQEYAVNLRDRAGRIIKSEEPMDRISDDPAWFECRNCPARGMCHEDDTPNRSCRTCLHSTPIENGEWHCDRWGKTLSLEEQLAGCPAHLYLPPLVPGEVTGTTEISVTYRMKNGSTWVDSEGALK